MNSAIKKTINMAKITGTELIFIFYDHKSVIKINAF